MKQKNNKGLILLISFLIILILGLLSYIIYDKNIIKYDKNIVTTIKKQTNEKIEELITEYNLENIREKIYTDEDFFLDYSKVVLENEKISNYREYVFKIFEVLVDNKENIDKEHFLNNLELLSINKVDYIDETTLGTALEQTIEFIDKYNTNHTIYHELLHFVDDSIKEKDYEQFFICNDFYDFSKEFKYSEYKEGCETYYNNSIYLFGEGGVEKYTAYYFNEKISESYTYEVNVLNILSYIFGEESIKKIFFSNHDAYELYKLLCIENGMSNIDFKQIMNIISNRNFVGENNIVDTLIDLYYLKNNTKWYENKIFSNMIQTLSYNVEENNKKYINEYKEYIKTKEMDDKTSDYIFNLELNNEKYKNTEGAVVTNRHFSIIDNKVYYVHHIFYEDFKDEVYKIDIDFESLSINGYELIEIDS